MEFLYIMGFINWFIVTMLLTGFFLVKDAERMVDDERYDDESRLISEAFLKQFEDGNFLHKVNFIFLCGARAWAIALFGRNG